MKIIIYLFTLLTIVFLGCSEKIDLTLDGSYTRLIVEGNITDEYKYQSVKLTKSANYFSNEKAHPYSNADVKLSTGDTTITLVENLPGTGVYLSGSKFKGMPGKTYTLHISNVSLNDKTQDYEASSSMQQTLTLDSITYFRFVPSLMETGQFGLTQDSTYYKINAWGQDPPAMGDCYMWSYFLNGTLQTDTISKHTFTDDALFNGNYIPGATIYAIKAKPGDTITIVTQSITREFYDFVMSLMLETKWSSGPMGGPPANIPSNISNGALGFFRATSVTYRSAIIK